MTILTNNPIPKLPVVLSLFDDGEILDLSPRSDIEGINKDTDSLIAIDYSDKRNVLNQNLVAIGTSGVGKTTYMKQKILRYIAKGVKVFIIDPEDEYSDIVERFGGEVVIQAVTQAQGLTR